MVNVAMREKIDYLSKTQVVVQARMGSRRLPGKTLMYVGNQRLIDHVLKRILSVIPNELVTLATTHLPIDDSLVNYVKDLYDIKIYRGSARDVQSRFIEIGNSEDSNYIVRITADDPFKDPKQIMELLGILVKKDLDYVNNFSPLIFPIGLDLEVFKLSSLILSRNLFDSEINREHVTFSLRESDYFRKESLARRPTLTKTRLTIDTAEDLKFCSIIAAELENEPNSFDWECLEKVLLKIQRGNSL